MAESEFNGSFLRRRRKRWDGYAVRDEGNGRYAVRSPGSDNRYAVTLSNKGWSCTCEYAKPGVENVALARAPRGLVPAADRAEAGRSNPIISAQRRADQRARPRLRV